MKKIYNSQWIIGLLFALSLLPGTVQAQLADSPWPMFGHDPQHTFCSQFLGPRNPFYGWISPDKNTRFKPGKNPVIGMDGTIYINADDYPKDQVWAFDPENGDINWIFTPEDGDNVGDLAIGTDNTIYFTARNYNELPNLYGINSNGSFKWKLKLTDAYYVSAPNIDSDGTIYVYTKKSDNRFGTLFAINSDGTLKWQKPGRGGTVTPAIGLDGNIFYASNDSIFSVNKEGAINWGYFIPNIGNIWSHGVETISIDSDSTVLVVVKETYGKIYALNPDGSLKWEFSSDYRTQISRLGLCKDGTKVLTVSNDKLIVLNPDGTVKWEKTIDYSKFSIDSSGVIYIVTQENDLLAIAPDSTTVFSFKLSEDFWGYGTPIIGENGTLYISTISNTSGAMIALFDSYGKPPSQPQNFAAFAGDNKVRLTWDINLDNDMSHYVIYRNLNPGFTPGKKDSIGRVNHPDNEFLDTGLVNGTTYYYKIYAVDTEGNKSSVSQEVEATPNPPSISMTSPVASATVRSMPVRVNGNFRVGEAFSVEINGTDVEVTGTEFSTEIYLTNGPREIIANLWSSGDSLLASDTIQVSVRASTPCIGMPGKYYRGAASSLDWFKFELDRFRINIFNFEARVITTHRTIPLLAFTPVVKSDKIIQIVNNGFKFSDKDGPVNFSFSGTFNTRTSVTGKYTASMDPYYGGSSWSAKNDTAQTRVYATLRNLPSQIPQNSEIEYQVLVRNSSNTSHSLEYAAEVHLINGTRIFDLNPKQVLLDPGADSLLTAQLHIPAGSDTATVIGILSTSKEPVYVFQRDISKIDTIPPAPITDLEKISKTDTSATLRWTAPGDDGNNGKASKYEMRYTKVSNDTTDWWKNASKVDNMPTPSAPDTMDSVTVSPLDSGYTYIFAIKTADNANNWSEISNVERVTTPVKLSSIEIPRTFELSQNYPNPFNPETTIEYQLPKISEVTIKIYNIVGQLVKTLVDQKQPAGYYRVNWNGKDDVGRDVASGVYFYRLRANDFVKTRKMALVR